MTDTFDRTELDRLYAAAAASPKRSPAPQDAVGGHAMSEQLPEGRAPNNGYTFCLCSDTEATPLEHALRHLHNEREMRHEVVAYWRGVVKDLRRDVRRWKRRAKRAGWRKAR